MKYGAILQLYHVKSGKFVTLIPTVGGKLDKAEGRGFLAEARELLDELAGTGRK